MRIGITTFHTSNENYGQLLQAYASLHFLKKHGHDASIIGYYYNSLPPVKKDYSFFGLLKKAAQLRYWKFLLKKIFDPIKAMFINKFIVNNNTDRGFSEFRKEFLNTIPPKTLAQLESEKPDFDLILTGSDQVWGGARCNPFYYLSWVKDTRKGAIAASFGHNLAEEDPKVKDIAKYISSFDFITLREESGKEICTHCGRPDAEVICDPTVLLPQSDYESLINNVDFNCRNEVFFYFIGHNSEISAKSLIKLFKQQRWDYKYVTSQESNTYKKYFPKIREWLNGIRTAKYVVTNSFHGTVFSIIFNKPFAVIPLKSEGANNRIITLLKKLGLEHRICNSVDAVKKVLDGPIDYSEINSKLSSWRNECSETLMRHINNNH